MTSDDLSRIVAALGLPASCRLDRRVFKKMFLEGRRLSAASRKALTEDVERFDWRYALKPERVPFRAVRQGAFDFLEIVVLEVALRSILRVERIAAEIHRAIPYPTLVVLRHDSAEALNTATKRFAQDQSGTVVVERTFTTPWLGAALKPAERAFLASLPLASMRSQDFAGLHQEYLDRVVAAQIAERTAHFLVTEPPGTTERLAALDRIDRLEDSIAAQRRRLAAESHFNKQVDLGLAIRNLEAELATLLHQLQTTA